MDLFLSVEEIGRMLSANLWHRGHVRGTVSQWASLYGHETCSEDTSPLAVTPDHRILLDGHHRYLSATRRGILMMAVIDDPSDPRYPDCWKWLSMALPPAATRKRGGQL